ncbi:MAG: Nif3-like dinuclear metal center hexameric protein [Syntrophomonadaceae bacterium]|nr:Nif3-like dinuclear metal center hexameric protein [Syntrophomonadaceae bacterium]
MQATVRDISRLMESLYPPYIAEDWDNVGLQIGSLASPVKKIMVTLEADQEIVNEAIEQQIDLIITHHPLFFKPIKSINFNRPQGKLIKNIIQHNINIYTAHTNLDAGSTGLNEYLAEKLELQDITLLDASYSETLYKLVVYVPEEHETQVRQSITAAGAGHIGKYSDCTFRIQGTGTFLPREGSQPFIGATGQLEEVREYRLETIVSRNILDQVLDSMKQSHPYEEVAYDIYPLANKSLTYSPGRIGVLPQPMPLKEFCLHVKQKLDINTLRFVGDDQDMVKKIALVSGSGAGFINKARQQGCDLLLTGDLKYHEAKDAQALGLKVADAGHQQMERLMAPLLAEQLRTGCADMGYELEIIIKYSSECIKII